MQCVITGSVQQSVLLIVLQGLTMERKLLKNRFSICYSQFWRHLRLACKQKMYNIYLRQIAEHQKGFSLQILHL